MASSIHIYRTNTYRSISHPDFQRATVQGLQKKGYEGGAGGLQPPPYKSGYKVKQNHKKY